MLATIECLPVEVFEIVALDLDLPAYNALRLTSRQLQLLSFSSYAKRYFSELKTTLGSASLDRLINVARHSHLSDAVTVLDITLLNHRDYKLLKNISRVGRFPIPKRFPKVSGVKLENTSTEATLYDDVLKSEYPKCIVDRLASSLKALSNLKAIRFRAHHSEPYGWRSASMPEGDQLFRTKCFHAVVDAIIKSEINLTEFSTAKGKRMTTLSKCANLPYPALSLPIHCLQALQHRFASLESLTLSVIAAYNGASRIPGWENGLSNFISTAPSITSLALSLDRNHQISYYSAAIVRSLALSCRVPELESLQLVNCSIYEEDLIAFVQAHARSLHQLILADIRLLTGSWLSLWSSFKNLGSLRSLRLASLEGIKSPVIFRRRDKDRLRITLDVAKAGLPMVILLDNLSTACNMEIDLQSNGIEAE